MKHAASSYAVLVVSILGECTGFVFASEVGSASNTNVSAARVSQSLQDDPSCAIDQTQALRAAVAAAAGQKLVLPKGTFCLKTAASTLAITAPKSTIEGQGAATVIKWAAPRGTPIAPIIDVRASATQVTIHDIAFDHNTVSGSYTDPTYFGKDPWGGVAVSIQGDDFNGYGLWVKEGFDNCIGIAAMDPTKQIAIAGSPQRFTLNNIHTENCGSGVHSADRGGPGKLGAGINVGAGSAGVISNAVDFRSYCSFTADVGAGASASWSNITSFYARVDQRRDTPALYIGSPNNSFSNVTIIQPAGVGVWLDFGAAGSQLSNVNVKGAGTSCLRIKGSAAWSNVTCSDPSFNAPGMYPAIVVDTTAGSFGSFTLSGLNISTKASMPSYSIESIGTHAVTGFVTSASLPGKQGQLNIRPPTHNIYIDALSTNGRCLYDRSWKCTQPSSSKTQ